MRRLFQGCFLPILLAFSMVPSAAFAAVDEGEGYSETNVASGESSDGQGPALDASEQDQDGSNSAESEDSAGQAPAPEASASGESEAAEPDGPDSALEAILNAEPADLEGDYAQDEVIIVYEDEMVELAESADEATLEDMGVIEQEVVVEAEDNKMAGDISVAKLDESASVEEAVAAISEIPGVAYVQPNYEYRTEAAAPAAAPANDTRIKEQYYLTNSRLTDAWRYKTTSSLVTVAVVDSGCNLQHADLRENLLSDLAWDCVRNKKLQETASAADNYGDALGHGTMVSGVIAAKANNGAGIAGVSYDARILPLRVMDNSNKTYTSYLISALQKIEEYAKSGQAGNLKIVNMSLGGYADDPTFHYWVSRLRNTYGMTIVCSGGNGDKSGNPITAPCYPSDYAECIGVTALTQSGAHAYWSDYNPQKDISAPGENILSTHNSGGYGVADGSSFSAPIVSGVAAVLLAACPDATAADVYNAVRESASAVTGAQRPSNGSAGAVNAIGALAYLGVDTSAIYNWVASYESSYQVVYSYSFYRSAYADLRSAFGYDRRQVFAHFVNHGMAEGRRASASFDVASYYNAYPDLRRAFGTDTRALAMHYVASGCREGRTTTGVADFRGFVASRAGVDYSPVYDGAYYAGAYADLCAAYTVRKPAGAALLDDAALLAHFVNHGMAEGRQAKASFDVRTYRSLHSDLRAAFGTDLRSYYMHYMNHGMDEGRKAA